jgi:hypothetical protein
MTTMSGVISGTNQSLAGVGAGRQESTGLFIELARELAGRLGLAAPALPPERRSVQ